MVPPRADLPAGTVNYVTEVGYAELIAERDQLIHERDTLAVSDENEKRITVNFINANIRAEDQKGLQAELLEITKICSLVVLFVLCVFLIIFICVTLSAKKDKKYSEDD